MKTAAICIATYKRTEGLLRLLRAVRGQRVPEGWSIEVRVVNNDPDAAIGSWEGLVLDILPDAITRYQPRRNIALARNLAVASGPADAFLFIDDDEVPSEHWLAALLERMDDADVAIGPVAGRVPGGTAPWLVRSGVFNKPGPPHDGPIQWTQTRTSSAAVRGEWLGTDDLWFDASYGISGGSDVEFFRRIAHRGARLVHERRALVIEDIEHDRCSWPAVLRRRYRAGAVLGRMEQQQGALLRHMRLAKRLVGGSVFVCAGAVSVIVGQPALLFHGICRCAVGIGAWRGHDPEYRVIRYPARVVQAIGEDRPCASHC